METPLWWRELDSTIHVFKKEQANERITNRAWIYAMIIINIISLLIHILSLKQLVDMSAKIQTLEKVTSENNAILADNLQALRNIQTSRGI